MRVTQNSTANQVLNNLQTIRERQDQLEQYASTGVKVSAPGDDPTTAQQILHLKSLSAASDQYTRNITNATSVLTMSDSAMSGMGDVLVRAKEVALSMANDTNSSDSRTAALNELTQLKDQLITLGNTQFNGKYIFAGFKNDTPPFDAAGTFSGSGNPITMEVSQDAKVQVNYPGDKLLSGAGGGTNVMQIFDNLTIALTAGSTAGVQAELSNLDSANSQILAARSVVGSSANRLASIGSVNDDQKLTTTKVMSGLQDVDYLQVVSDLTKQQTAYQTAVAASAKISQISLLDYLK